MIDLDYKQLVFKEIKYRDSWRGPYHHNRSYGVMVTLVCGHWKMYNKNNVPKHVAQCNVCTLTRATDAKNKPLLKRVK